MFLPAVLFIAGAVFFLRIGKIVFSPKFFFSTLKKDGKSSLSSLWLALGGTLGVGNICGVCAAISLGGAGCVFWIWVCAILSAVTKYAETVLAVHFREKTESGFTGGAHTYIKNGLGAKHLAIFFCFLCIFTAFTMGNITQVKSAADFACFALDIPRAIVGLIFFIFVLILTLGKGKAISSFTAKVVPALCVFYTVGCIFIIFVCRERISSVTGEILRSAFTPRAGMGGFIGVLCSPAIRLGITRGVMSNEAGCGTAPIAYAADPAAEPVKSGLLGICEVLCDTLLLCTLTAYAVLLPGVPLSENSAQTVISAFSSVMGATVSPFLSVSVFLFALASIAAWAFYSLSCASALGLKKGFSVFFALLYSATAFFGCFASEGAVWVLSDLSVSAMAIINVVAVTLMFGKVRKITEQKASEIKP